jgi:hypothetical protein
LQVPTLKKPFSIFLRTLSQQEVFNADRHFIALSSIVNVARPDDFEAAQRDVANSLQRPLADDALKIVGAAETKKTVFKEHANRGGLTFCAA